MSEMQPITPVVAEPASRLGIPHNEYGETGSALVYTEMNARQVNNWREAEKQGLRPFGKTAEELLGGLANQ